MFLKTKNVQTNTSRLKGSNNKNTRLTFHRFRSCALDERSQGPRNSAIACRTCRWLREVFKFSQFSLTPRRGEYFYLSSNVHCCLIFFLLCRNIQFGVSCVEIFISWSIVQKYWSGIVTCYTAIRIDYLDLTNVSGMLP